MTPEDFKGTGVLFINGRDVGLADAHVINNGIENADLIDFREPGGGLYNRITRVSERLLNITLRDYNKENLILHLRGTATDQATSTVTDESITSGPALGALIPTANMVDIAQAVTVTSDPAGTNYTLGTDFVVYAAGIVALASGNIPVSTPLLISYTAPDAYTVNAEESTKVEHPVILTGKDEAQENRGFIFHAPRVVFDLQESIALIQAADEYGALEMSPYLLPTTGTPKYWSLQKTLIS